MRIGVLQSLGLGDFLTALPAIRAARRAFPDADLTWVGKLEYLELIEPLFTDAHELRALVDPVEIPAFDVGINLHGCGPMSHQRLYRSGKVVGFYQERYSPDGPAWSKTRHIRSLWTSLLNHYGFPADPDDFLLGSGRLSGHVVVHVDARDQDRWWPLERFQEVMAGIDQEVIVIGERLGQPRSLEETCELVRNADLVIGADSGVTHLAYAYQRPSITLFGPAPALRWGPPAHARHKVMGNINSFEEIRPEGPCSPHLLEVTPDEVLTAAKELLTN